MTLVPPLERFPVDSEERMDVATFPVDRKQRLHEATFPSITRSVWMTLSGFQ